MSCCDLLWPRAVEGCRYFSAEFGTPTFSDLQADAALRPKKRTFLVCIWFIPLSEWFFFFPHSILPAVHFTMLCYVFPNQAGQICFSYALAFWQWGEAIVFALPLTCVPTSLLSSAVSKPCEGIWDDLPEPVKGKSSGCGMCDTGSSSHLRIIAWGRRKTAAAGKAG